MSGVQSIERAFTLLRALRSGPAGVTELADRVDLPKSTVARILCALCDEGMVGQDGFGGDYHLGSALGELVPETTSPDRLIAAGRPHLERLAARTGAGTGLAVLEDDAVVYLDHVADPDERWGQWSEDTFPPHLVPSGLALLAGEPPRSVDAYLAEARPPRPAPGALRARLADICRTGHLWFRSAFAPDLVSVAAPVWGPDGTTLAAVHAQGPVGRFPGGDGPQVSRLIRHTADRLGAALA